MGNPFVFSKPLTEGPAIARESELSTLLKRFEEGVNTRLASPRDYGKTSLLYALCRAVSAQGGGAVIVDLYGATTAGQMAQKIDSVYAGLPGGAIKRAATSLRRRGGGFGLSTPLGGGSATVGREGGSERLLLDALALPHDVAQKTGRRMLVCFDEFQEVLKAELDGIIRGVVQHHGDAVTYVFSGSHPGMMRELFGDRKRPFFGQAAPLDLPRFRDEQIADFVSASFDQTGKSADVVMDDFLAEAAGHPQRSMLLAHLLWDRTPDGGEADHETLAAALDDAWPYIQDQFEAIWDRCSRLEAGVLEAVAAGVQSLRGAHAREQFGLTSGSGSRRAADRLLSSGTLVEVAASEQNERKLYVDDPFFARWIRSGRSWVI